MTSVTVSPATATVARGGNHDFTATVSGTNNPPTTVTWTVTGGGPGTSISTAGRLTVTADETATSLTVQATSTHDTARSGTATVTAAPTDMTINVPGIPATHNGRTAWVVLWSFPNENFVTEAQGTITAGSLSVTIPGVPAGTYFVDVEIESPGGLLEFIEMNPRSLSLGNNDIPWTAFFGVMLKNLPV